MDRKELNRLRWRCTRRALLELDLLLGKFLEEGFSELTDAQARVFAEMADMEDHELWPLVNGSQECEDPQQAEVIALLRKCEVRRPL